MRSLLSAIDLSISRCCARSSLSSALLAAAIAGAMSINKGKNNFEKSNLALVFGWGGAMWGDGGGLVNLGIRLTYGLSDIISIAGGKRQDYYAFSDGITATPKSYKPTNTATIGFHLTYDFDLGWWLHDSCKRKYKFFLFKMSQLLMSHKNLNLRSQPVHKVEKL